jgi:hypothetical protein
MTERTMAAVDAALGAESAGYARGVALVALAGVFWSLGGLLVRWIEVAGTWQIIFYRSFALVLTLLAITALRHRGRLGAAFVAAGWNGIAAGPCLAAAHQEWSVAARWGHAQCSALLPSRGRSIPGHRARAAWHSAGRDCRRGQFDAAPQALARCRGIEADRDGRSSASASFTLAHHCHNLLLSVPNRPG